MRPFQIFLTCSCLLLFAACEGSVGTSADDSYARFDEKGVPISFEYPESWQPATVDGALGAVSVAGDNVNAIIVREAAAEPLSAAEITSRFDVEVKAVGDNDGGAVATIGKNEFVVYTTKYEIDAKPVQGNSYGIAAGSQTVTLICQFNDKGEKDVLKACGHALDTLKADPVQPAPTAAPEANEPPPDDAQPPTDLPADEEFTPDGSPIETRIEGLWAAGMLYQVEATCQEDAPPTRCKLQRVDKPAVTGTVDVTLKSRNVLRLDWRTPTKQWDDIHPDTFLEIEFA